MTPPSRGDKPGVPIEGASDHGVSEAIYLRDPDGNGIELYRDHDPEQWPCHPDGSLAMKTLPLDMTSLLAELGAGAAPVTAP